MMLSIAVAGTDRATGKILDYRMTRVHMIFSELERENGRIVEEVSASLLESARV